MIRAGKITEARSEMGKIEALSPRELPQVKSWFEGRIRNGEKEGR